MVSQEHLRRLGIAVHEAGHAVMYVVLKVGGLVYVTIEPSVDVDENGYVGVGLVKTRPTRAFAWPTVKRAMVTSLAGEAAERYGTGYHDYQFETDPSESDRRFVLDIASFHYEEPKLSRFLARMENRTEQLVKRHWTSIDAVARELLLHRTLTAKEVREVVHLSERMRYDDEFFETMVSQR